MISSFLCKNSKKQPTSRAVHSTFTERGTWNGVKLCHWRWLDAVTTRAEEEGPLSYSVVVGGWTSLGPTTNQTPHPSILLTSNQGLNPGNYTLWESEWQFFQRAGTAIAIFQEVEARSGFFKEHRSLVENPDGACRSVPQFCLAWAAVWSDAVQILWSVVSIIWNSTSNLKQCK